MKRHKLLAVQQSGVNASQNMKVHTERCESVTVLMQQSVGGTATGQVGFVSDGGSGQSTIYQSAFAIPAGQFAVAAQFGRECGYDNSAVATRSFGCPPRILFVGAGAPGVGLVTIIEVWGVIDMDF